MSVANVTLAIVILLVGILIGSLVGKEHNGYYMKQDGILYKAMINWDGWYDEVSYASTHGSETLEVLRELKALECKEVVKEFPKEEVIEGEGEN